MALRTMRLPVQNEHCYVGLSMLPTAKTAEQGSSMTVKQVVVYALDKSDG
jgi:hypothetical protein